VFGSFTHLPKKDKINLKKYGEQLLGAILFASNAIVCLGYADYKLLLINIPLLFSVFIVELYTKATNPFRNIAFTILGIVYVAVPFSLLNYLVTFTG
jgi:phosphatidate cytidylyltransferase